LRAIVAPGTEPLTLGYRYARVGQVWSRFMRVWNELREVVWLASVVWGASIVGVGLAVALALVLDAWVAIPSGVAHF
jgi:hypothetical protein